jgi:hypothetical protein
MKTLRKLLETLEGSMKVLIFLGMLAVTGFTLLALSPVSYEDYQAYLNLKNSNPEKTFRNVAGVNTVDNGSSEGIGKYFKLSHFLQKYKLEYSISTKETGFSLNISNYQTAIPASDFSSILNIVEIENTSSAVKQVRVNLGNLNKNYAFSLASSGEIHNISANSTVILKLAPGEKLQYRLSRIAGNTDQTNPLELSSDIGDVLI